MINSVTSLPNGSKQLGGTGQPGTFVMIEATGSLRPAISWEVLDVQLVDGTGQIHYTDTAATNHPCRFYRFTTP